MTSARLDRLAALPRLGVGISAEFDSARTGIDAVELAAARPDLLHFLEYGADLDRGLDEHVLRAADSGMPVTYHFLDVNLEEPQDVDAAWIDGVRHHLERLSPRWLCGDAGLWHFGPRDRTQMILLPPVLCEGGVAEMAEAVLAVEEATGLLCLPENPPAPVYLGPLHLLDYYGRVLERTGGGMLIDTAHLTIFQRSRGHAPTTGLDGFPLDRVVELHVAGGLERDADGFRWIEDAHNPEPLADTWEILDYVLPRAPNLKAICYECERNRAGQVVEVFERLNALFPAVAAGA
jgi:uncharacterized protein (UPF0276 family)